MPLYLVAECPVCGKTEKLLHHPERSYDWVPGSWKTVGPRGQGVYVCSWACVVRFATQMGARETEA